MAVRSLMLATPHAPISDLMIDRRFSTGSVRAVEHAEKTIGGRSSRRQRILPRGFPIEPRGLIDLRTTLRPAWRMLPTETNPARGRHAEFLLELPHCNGKERLPWRNLAFWDRPGALAAFGAPKKAPDALRATRPGHSEPGGGAIPRSGSSSHPQPATYRYKCWRLGTMVPSEGSRSTLTPS